MSGVLVVDKPKGASSHDVVQWARRAFGTRAVGHAGTLDPMATGVLVVLLGAATKLSPFLTSADKRYLAEIALGASTDTLDADGIVIREMARPHELSARDVHAALEGLLGEVDQEAPVVSAIKVDGRPLHERVRRGEDVSAPTRRVVLHEVDVLEAGPECIRLEIACGKGYYVRSLARDLAHRLGTVGHLRALRRTASGSFQLERSVPGERLRELPRGTAFEALSLHILSMEAACEGMVTASLTEIGAAHARHGRRIPLEESGLVEPPAPEAPVAMFAPTGQLLAIGRAEGPDTLRVVRGFCH